MKIHLSGHHVEITDGIKEHIDAKFEKIANKYPSLLSATVILSLEHNENCVEISTTYEGSQVAAKGNDKVLYPAIATALKKFDAALAHRKGVLKARLHKKPEVSTPEIAHEKVQEMRL